MDRVLYICGGIIALGGAGTVIAKAARRMLSLLGEMREFLSDWRGEPERPGVPARLGVMERLERIEHQLIPNGGASNTTADRLVRVERATGADRH